MRLCHMAGGGGAMRGGVGGQPWLLRRDGYGYVGTLLRLATPHALNPGGFSSEGSPCPEERSLTHDVKGIFLPVLGARFDSASGPFVSRV